MAITQLGQEDGQDRRVRNLLHRGLHTGMTIEHPRSYSGDDYDAAIAKTGHDSPEATSSSKDERKTREVETHY